MRIYGGLKREDWERWGQFTTFKENAADLLRRSLKSSQTIYCSPLTDPYQPAEGQAVAMPGILRALIERPPSVFVIQTRGSLILRDLNLLTQLRRVTTVRISFSVTTNRDDVRRRYEPHCDPIPQRIATIERLREAGLAVHATLAPILPCDPEELAAIALAATDLDLIGDPFHERTVKPTGATTRDAALKLSRRLGHEKWHEPAFQAEIAERIRRTAEAAGRGFGVGAAGFAKLAVTGCPR